MPVWIYIVGAILLFIALLLSIKVNIIISYNEEVNVFLRILFVRIKLYPQKIKIKKQKNHLQMMMLKGPKQRYSKKVIRAHQ